MSSGVAGFLAHGIAPPAEFRAAAGARLGATPEWQSACLSTPPIPEETRVVVLNGNRLEEFDFESSTKKQVKGNIYLAKVTRVEPSLQAAFVEYGGNRHGFLAFSEIHPDYYRIPVGDRSGGGAEPQSREFQPGCGRGRGRNRRAARRRRCPSRWRSSRSRRAATTPPTTKRLPSRPGSRRTTRWRVRKTKPRCLPNAWEEAPHFVSVAPEPAELG